MTSEPFAQAPTQLDEELAVLESVTSLPGSMRTSRGPQTFVRSHKCNKEMAEFDSAVSRSTCPKIHKQYVSDVNQQYVSGQKKGCKIGCQHVQLGHELFRLATETLPLDSVQVTPGHGREHGYGQLDVKGDLWGRDECK